MEKVELKKTEGEKIAYIGKDSEAVVQQKKKESKKTKIENDDGMNYFPFFSGGGGE